MAGCASWRSSDPGNAAWQRDLSVSHNKVGDAEVAQGNLPAALAFYQERLASAEHLAKTDPGNADLQRDLIVSYAKIAEADPSRARTMLTRGHVLHHPLAKRADNIDAHGKLLSRMKLTNSSILATGLPLCYQRSRPV